MTMMSAAMIPQPPIHPVRGPKARAAQVNVVPQSGSRLFSSEYATAISHIGMKASSMIPAAFTPTAMTTKPSVAASVQAGAVEDTPITIEDTSPIAPPLRPLSIAVPSVRTTCPGRGDAELIRQPSWQSCDGYRRQSAIAQAFRPFCDDLTTDAVASAPAARLG